ncbi:MAG: segregation/condensation protein A, partial [Sarcina sp.]
MEKLTFKLKNFDGPFDLLLHLIRKNKMSISDIPIHEITQQYLQYINIMEE